MLVLALLACNDCRTVYTDVDGDSFGATAIEYCKSLEGTSYVDNAEDCDDDDPEVSPAGTEVCNGIDDNCDGSTDEGLLSTFYRDRDGDDYGGEESEEACELISGYVAEGGDCDDYALAVHPGAEEVCDEVDQDCDEAVDEGALNTYYGDGDDDGYGDDDTLVEGCTTPEGASDEGGDCDDENSTVYPGATEYCDEVDNDCNGETDEGVKGTYYVDGDGDGYALDGADSVEACYAPSGYADKEGDCDDSTGLRSPANSEDCSSGLDDDCDGLLDCEDGDCDGQTGCVEGDCTDGVDNEGDGYKDCEDSECWVEPTCIDSASTVITDGTGYWNKWTWSYGGQYSSHSEGWNASSISGELRLYGEFGTATCGWTQSYLWQATWSYSSYQYAATPVLSSACPFSFATSQWMPKGFTAGAPGELNHDQSGAWLRISGTIQTFSYVGTSWRSYGSYLQGGLSTGDPWEWTP